MVDNQEQLDRIEKKLDELDKKMDKHIKEIWTVYVPIKKLLEKLERFRLWYNGFYVHYFRYVQVNQQQ